MMLEPAKELPPDQAAALRIAAQQDLIRSLERRLEGARHQVVELEAKVARLLREAGK